MTRKTHNDLRQILIYLKDHLKLSLKELSDAIQLSRPTVTLFLNPKTTEQGETPEERLLPVTRQGLINLWNSIKPDNKKTDYIFDIEQIPEVTLKVLINKIGPDELLETANFLPQKDKYLRVSPDIYNELLQMTLILEMFDFKEAISTIRDCSSNARNKLSSINDKLFSSDYKNNNSDALAHLIDQLLTADFTLGLMERLKIYRKLDKTHKRLIAGGKKHFNKEEAISLFLSITIKEKLTKELVNINIRIQKLDFKTVSLAIEEEDEYKKDEYKDLYYEFLKIGNELEAKVKNTPYIGEDGKKDTYLFNPVIKAIITYRLSFNDQPIKQIQATYTSSNTPNENAISALSLYLGFNKKLEQIRFFSQKVLNGDIHGLIETTAILEEDEKHYQGIWVDRNGMIGELQAIAEAGKYWLSEKILKNELKSEIYESACDKVSDLRKQLLQARTAFQDFQFLDLQKNDTNSEKTIDLEYSNNTLKNIANTAEKELLKIPHENIYESYRLSLYRCYFHAKLLELRQANLGGKINDVNNLLKEIKKKFHENEKVKTQFTPINTLINVEIYLYELSSGRNLALFNDNKRKEYINLNEQVEQIINAINKQNFYKDSGSDIYFSLAEITGNTARIDFYLSNERAIIEECRQNFLQAAYYASRIGATRRMARWISLAGRASIRLKDGEFARQALEFSNHLLNKTLNYECKENFKDAIFSETYILEGEYNLLEKNKPSEALVKFFKALKGAIYLGLNRRILDSLFNIYRWCETSDNVSIVSIKEAIKIFSEQNTNLGNIKNNLLNPTENGTSQKALGLLIKLESFEDSIKCSQPQVKDEIIKVIKDVWNGWHTDSEQSTIKDETQHPIADLIDRKDKDKKLIWLKQL